MFSFCKSGDDLNEMCSKRLWSYEGGRLINKKSGHGKSPSNNITRICAYYLYCIALDVSSSKNRGLRVNARLMSYIF